MNLEMLEYLKFLHIHGLVDIVVIIDSIPIYYQTQIKSFNHKSQHNQVFKEKMRLQTLTFIAKHGFSFSFPNFKFNFQTYRTGPYSLDIENELLNLINSEVFNNAVSIRKQYARRYPINSYDKQQIIDMFKGETNYRDFLENLENKDLCTLRDIGLSVFFHNQYVDHQDVNMRRLYLKSDINKYKILHSTLKNVVTWKKDSNAYIKNLIDLVLSLNLRKSQNLPNLLF